MTPDRKAELVRAAARYFTDGYIGDIRALGFSSRVEFGIDLMEVAADFEKEALVLREPGVQYGIIRHTQIQTAEERLRRAMRPKREPREPQLGPVEPHAHRDNGLLHRACLYCGLPMEQWHDTPKCTAPVTSQ